MSDLSADERQVLRAFLRVAKGETADVLPHQLVREARLPPDEIRRALQQLRSLGYITELRKYGPGRRLIPTTRPT